MLRTAAVSVLLIAAPVSAAGPASVSTLPPATQAAVDRLFEAMQLATTFDALIGQMVPLFMQPLSGANPGRSDDIQRIVTEELTAAMRARRATFIAVARESYGRHFSVAEIDGLTAFYGSPLGLKMLREQLPISKELSAIGAQIGQQAGAEAAPRIVARLKADKLNVPKSS